ncbi:hypothetical protein C6P46_002483 [Rhodotorula mucilaginosa]|uniref:RRM domain-containing protein n=1 Tax=Rhodotorula mucilaginosa TaxID=5537 RepID=A0A9P7B1J9_RHOMI|nr:hypothetical protein C6P46_002483 [Rhodotorula mucilaginosa]
MAPTQLYVGNLSCKTTDVGLENAFSRFGELAGYITLKSAFEPRHKSFPSSLSRRVTQADAHSKNAPQGSHKWYPRAGLASWIFGPGITSSRTATLQSLTYCSFSPSFYTLRHFQDGLAITVNLDRASDSKDRGLEAWKEHVEEREKGGARGACGAGAYEAWTITPPRSASGTSAPQNYGSDGSTGAGRAVWSAPGPYGESTSHSAAVFWPPPYPSLGALTKALRIFLVSHVEGDTSSGISRHGYAGGSGGQDYGQ